MLNKIDKKIISALQRDGRQSYADLARKLEISESTVKRRLDRLLKHNIIRVAVVTNPTKMGLIFSCTMRLEVKKSKVRQFGRELAQNPNVYYLGFTTGEFDIIALLLFKSPQDLANFMWEDISTRPAVTKTDTVVNIEIIKSPWMADLDVETLLES